MQPGGVIFSGCPPSKGAWGRDPLEFFFTKSCQITISIKSITKNNVFFTELGAIIISARGRVTEDFLNGSLFLLKPLKMGP